MESDPVIPASDRFLILKSDKYFGARLRSGEQITKNEQSQAKEANDRRNSETKIESSKNGDDK